MPKVIRKGIEGQAKTILSQIYKGASDRDLDEKVAYIKEFTEDRRPGTASQKAWSDFKSLYTVPSNLRALIIACGLQGIQVRYTYTYYKECQQVLMC
jgi:SP family myo-inositol transporter-like MFS transporter 13